MRAACDIIEVDGASHRAENWWPSQWGYKPRIVDWLSRTLAFTARRHAFHPRSADDSTVASGRGAAAAPNGSATAGHLAKRPASTRTSSFLRRTA